MNKSELIKAIAEQADVSQADSARMLNALTEIVGDSLAKDDSVVIANFGIFSMKERSARTGRNPQTGETIEIKAKKLAHFKPYTALNDKL